MFENNVYYKNNPLINIITLIFSGVILDKEFTQKLQNIMGKSSQSPVAHTPTNNTIKSESEIEITSQNIIPPTSDVNSRFSISPVSEYKAVDVSGEYYL